MEASGKSHAKVPLEIQRVIKEFVGVFRDPIDLPPERGHDHTVVLKEGIDSVNVRSYRYPHAQKNEIERLLGEMLAVKVIRPSVSPLSSLVLIVKKKDSN